MTQDAGNFCRLVSVVASRGDLCVFFGETKREKRSTRLRSVFFYTKEVVLERLLEIELMIVHVSFLSFETTKVFTFLKI